MAWGWTVVNELIILERSGITLVEAVWWNECPATFSLALTVFAKSGPTATLCVTKGKFPLGVLPLLC